MSGAVLCELCPRACVIPDGAAGDCRVRVNVGGRLQATTYGRPSALHIDPIEKKPFYHYHPGTTAFSLATAGCNLHCRNCQNWELSQVGGHEIDVVYRAQPSEIVDKALGEGCATIACTYSEPLVYYEYTRDIAALGRERGVPVSLVTAAYICREPLRRLCGVVDAATVDIKSFDDAFYRSNCGGSLQPVLDALVAMREEGLWLEVSTLVIPTLTDDLAGIGRMARWIRDELGAGTPFHLLRFHPQYRLQNLPPTPPRSLEDARSAALEAGLQFVYIGNVLGHDAESTRCPSDGTLLVRRHGTRVLENHLRNGACPTCGRAVPGRW